MNTAKTIHAPSVRGNAFIKATVLLTVCFFLISAPTPDARVISEITSDLIVSVETLSSEVRYL